MLKADDANLKNSRGIRHRFVQVQRKQFITLGQRTQNWNELLSYLMSYVRHACINP